MYEGLLQKDEGIKQEAQDQGDKIHTGEGWGAIGQGEKRLEQKDLYSKVQNEGGKGEGVTANRWPDLWNYLGKDSSMYTADLVEHSEKIRVGILGIKGLKKIRQFLISRKKS